MPAQSVFYFTYSWSLTTIVIKLTAVIIAESHYYQLHREV